MKPLSQPIVSQREFKAIVKQSAHDMGFSHPWRVAVAFHDSRKDDWPHEDHDVYACAHPQPQYHRCEIHTDLRHYGWTKETSVAECVRHELAHVLVSGYTMAVTNHMKNKQILSMLELEEDKLVNWIACMPFWDK